MAFYDSVKDDIREEAGEPLEDSEDDSVAFDQLKKDAEEDDDDDDREMSSDTDIEVLGRGGMSQPEEDSSAPDSARSPAAAVEEDGATEIPAESSAEDTVEILRRIEAQNDEMLSVLRGIKRSLE